MRRAGQWVRSPMQARDILDRSGSRRVGWCPQVWKDTVWVS